MTQKLKFEQLEHFGFGPGAMQKTKLCPYCSSLLTNGESTCFACGMPLPELTLLEWYVQQHDSCAHCGTLLARGSRYCAHCGKRVLQRPAEKRV